MLLAAHRCVQPSENRDSKHPAEQCVAKRPPLCASPWGESVAEAEANHRDEAVQDIDQCDKLRVPVPQGQAPAAACSRTRRSIAKDVPGLAQQANLASAATFPLLAHSGRVPIAHLLPVIRHQLRVGLRRISVPALDFRLIC